MSTEFEPAGGAVVDGALRVLGTPLGPLVIARQKAWVRSGDGLFLPRRIFFAEPEDLVVTDEVQVVFWMPPPRMSDF